ncbi:MAG: hypothetical protein AAB373_03325 [Patescibacteria group bacterium]
MTKLIERTTIERIQIQPIPKSWKLAAGLANNKKKTLADHGKRIRNEWDKK